MSYGILCEATFDIKTNKHGSKRFSYIDKTLRFDAKKNTVQKTEQWPDQRHPQSESTIKYWFREFKRGRSDTNDAGRSGRPNEAVTPAKHTKNPQNPFWPIVN